MTVIEEIDDANRLIHRGQFQIHYLVSGLNTYGQNLLVQNTRCYYAWLWQVRM